MRRTLLLDLDGTIVDSVPDLAAALNRLMAARGLPGFSAQETAAMVGDGVQRLVERAFDARGRAPDPDAVADYVADYDENFAVATRLYPGVQPTLAGMRRTGWQFAVCTNKLEAPARALLDALGLSGMFAAVGGGDSVPMRKPDPRHLLATLRVAGGAVGHAVMAGDHANDVAAAHGAGVPCIFATWGYGAPEMGAAADRVAASFADLPGFAEALLPVNVARSGGRT
ncbi:MAG: HAD family hydrolase [Acetobacteraceae bacterium]